MSIWIGIGIMTLGILALLIVPSLRRKSEIPEDGESHQNFDIAVYKDQLAEVERDVERGLVSEQEAETVRLEIKRRLLYAADQAAATGDGEPLRKGLAIPVLSVAAFAGAFALYLHLGSPQMPDFPFADRGNLEGAPVMSSPAHSVDDAIAQLETRLQTNPDDPEGWMTLGRSYLSMERYPEAQKAFLNLYDLTGDIRAKAEYAEALILGSDAQVTPEALEIFQQVLNADPFDPKARFYFGVAAAQQGNLDGALQIWTDLLHLSPPDAPWISIVRSQIQRAAQEAGVDPATLTPTESVAKLAEESGVQMGESGEMTGTPGPSQEDIEAAQEMTADEQMEMIRSMVQRLADRLEDDPSDHAGWLRLAQAYEVLGETAKAAEARRRAAEVAP